MVSAAVLGAAALTAGLVSAASADRRPRAQEVVRTASAGVDVRLVEQLRPTGEYLANGIAIWTNLLGRNLVGYNHVAGGPGNVPVPDLATAIPKPTNGLKTYTFKLKGGIRFGPPVNREITSTDIRYAIERGATKNGAQYPFYFNVIKGFEAYGKGEGTSVSGIKTPNAKTIVFNLTRPTGDFPNRLGMPAAGAMPQEVAGASRGSRANTAVMSSPPGRT